jgi:hypothetical protein
MRFRLSWTTGFLFGTTAVVGLAHADTLSIKVKLWQHGGKGGIEMSQDHMPAGAVEFVVTNTSVDPVDGKMHELLIAPWSGPASSLPYDSKKAVVEEGRLPHLEGLEDMLPSATATMRVVLTPGTYYVFSNQLPHDVESGMVKKFTVEPQG